MRNINLFDKFTEEFQDFLQSMNINYVSNIRIMNEGTALFLKFRHSLHITKVFYTVLINSKSGETYLEHKNKDDCAKSRKDHIYKRVCSSNKYVNIYVEYDGIGNFNPINRLVKVNKDKSIRRIIFIHNERNEDFFHAFLSLAKCYFNVENHADDVFGNHYVKIEKFINFMRNKALISHYYDIEEAKISYRTNEDERIFNSSRGNNFLINTSLSHLCTKNVTSRYVAKLDVSLDDTLNYRCGTYPSIKFENNETIRLGCVYGNFKKTFLAEFHGKNIVLASDGKNLLCTDSDFSKVDYDFIARIISYLKKYYNKIFVLGELRGSEVYIQGSNSISIPCANRFLSDEIELFQLGKKLSKEHQRIIIEFMKEFKDSHFKAPEVQFLMKRLEKLSIDEKKTMKNFMSYYDNFHLSHITNNDRKISYSLNKVCNKSGCYNISDINQFLELGRNERVFNTRSTHENTQYFLEGYNDNTHNLYHISSSANTKFNKVMGMKPEFVGILVVCVVMIKVFLFIFNKMFCLKKKSRPSDELSSANLMNISNRSKKRKFY